MKELVYSVEVVDNLVVLIDEGGTDVPVNHFEAQLYFLLVGFYVFFDE